MSQEFLPYSCTCRSCPHVLGSKIACVRDFSCYPVLIPAFLHIASLATRQSSVCHDLHHQGRSSSMLACVVKKKKQSRQQKKTSAGPRYCYMATHNKHAREVSHKCVHHIRPRPSPVCCPPAAAAATRSPWSIVFCVDPRGINERQGKTPGTFAQAPTTDTAAAAPYRANTPTHKNRYGTRMA